ncbi:restriction endonuclease subunit S [Streptococcus sp. 596553]|uniref:restriction endonuclease subunit S n=1 Tax=Streptococcus sp. 596553 TaxID=2250596 RepID=UPI000DD8DE2E|nr:restriction endonuclease subunit S [Streptococcus sp. 596553]
MIKQPSYRFVGFEDEWKEVKVSDIFRVTRGQVLATTQISEEKTDTYKYPVYSSQTKNEGLLGYYDKYLFETAITWTTDGANAGTVNYREGKFYSTNVNGVLLSDEGFANKVIAEILNNEAWKYVSKVGNPKLMNNVMSEISLVIPNDFREISILSTFFQDIDQLISLQQRKLEVLKEQKKTYLKLLFSAKGQIKPALRFAGFENDWKEVKLGEVCSIKGGNAWKSEHYSTDGKYLVVTISNVKGNEYIDDTYGNRIDTVESQFILEQGNILISLTGNVGRVSKMTEVAAVLNQRVGKLATNQSNNFLFTLLSNRNFEKEMVLSSQGAAQANISNNDVLNYKTSFPSLPEQEAIGSFFQDLDKSIAKQEEKVNQLKESKQTLLRKMFI